MDQNHLNMPGTNNRRAGMALAVYAGVGSATTLLLLAARAESGLPDALDTGFIGVFVAGFIATILLMKTRIAGGGPPIFHALRALAVALVIAAMGLLVAHWIELGNPTAHAQAAARASVQGHDAGCVENIEIRGECSGETR